MTVEAENVYVAYIDGRDVPAQDGETFEVLAPATGAHLAEVARCKSADVDEAIASGDRAAASWRNTRALDRGRLLVRLAAAVREHALQLAEMESASAGRLRRDALGDAEVAAQFLEFYGGLAPSLEGSTFGDRFDQLAYTVFEPYGITGHIIPWNFPLQTAARSIAPALAVGNVVVAKPAEQTPMTCLALAKLAVDCGLPSGVFNVVPGLGSEAGAALAEHPRVPRLAFTGSIPTGKRVLHAAAEHLCHATVELGGKSPLVVFDDADPSAAVAGVTKAILTHAGQVCAAGTRLLVQDALHDQVVEAIRERMDAVDFDSGDQADGIAPLSSATQRDMVNGYIATGIREGAILVTASDEPSKPGGYFVRPALFDRVTPDMTIAREEIFGPVLAVTSFSSLEEAAHLANASSYGLVAGIWTSDINKALKLARSLEAGTVYINDYYIGGVELPFGGYKNSGFGREKGRQALESFARIKSIAIAVAT